ncbi:DoxX family protein [Amycolatopsis lurida]
MTVAFFLITGLTAALNAFFAIADYLRAGFVLANSAKVDVPRSWLPMLGTAKLAGALGLVAGLFGLRYLGIAAAAGLTLFFTGAVVAHLRARVLDTMWFPAGILGLSAASLVLAIVH